MGDGKAVDHAGGAALFVAGAAGVEAAVFDFAGERVPLPFVGVADADGVDVAVVEKDAGAVADAAQGVAHACRSERRRSRGDVISAWARSPTGPICESMEGMATSSRRKVSDVVAVVGDVLLYGGDVDCRACMVNPRIESRVCDYVLST